MRSDYLLFRGDEVVGVFASLKDAIDSRASPGDYEWIQARDGFHWTGPRALGRWRVERWNVEGT